MNLKDQQEETIEYLYPNAFYISGNTTDHQIVKDSPSADIEYDIKISFPLLGGVQIESMADDELESYTLLFTILQNKANQLTDLELNQRCLSEKRHIRGDVNLSFDHIDVVRTKMDTLLKKISSRDTTERAEVESVMLSQNILQIIALLS